jgi:PAS domain S-box-containing protein/putative nucleotidyltransferase with HDIG domain
MPHSPKPPSLTGIPREPLDDFAQEAMRVSESRYRRLFETARDGILLLNADTGQIEDINPYLIDMLGYSRQELLGKKLWEVSPFADIAQSKELFIELQRNGYVRYHDIPLRTKYGSIIEVEVVSNAYACESIRVMQCNIRDITERMASERRMLSAEEKFRTAFMSTVEVATIICEMRDPYTVGHERRVAQIAGAIGAELGFNEDRQEGLQVAGHLHDIGKITVPAEILSRPGKLRAIEFQFIQEHALAGYEVLKSVAFPWPVAQVALQHHERMDGSGYPQGLQGEDILIEARIVAVADVVEAMFSHRPYRPGLGIVSALAEIERGRGFIYDADGADACLRLFRERGYQLTP